MFYKYPVDDDECETRKGLGVGSAPPAEVDEAGKKTKPAPVPAAAEPVPLGCR